MTEKRFVNKGKDIFQYGEWWCSANGEHCADVIVTAINELIEENEQLAKEKERYKRLSEIRREEINNRILTIKEFIENCSDNKVKKILEDLFYSEVKEYDLSAQNRKLLHENEKLKSENEDMRRLINNISLQRDEFHRGARENANRIGKLEKENEQLKQFKEKVFSLLDKEIAKNEKAIEWGKETGADSGSMGFYNHMLKILKKELKE